MMLRRWIFPRVVLLLFVLASGAYLKGAECSPPASMLAKLRAQPNSAAYSEVGTWFGNHKQFGCAAEAYRSALKAQAASPRILYLLGLSLFSAGRPEEAIAPLQQSIEVSPNVLQPHVILASALEKSQRNAEAKAEWEAALKIAPHSALALDGLARALLREGRSSDVLTLLGPAPTEETLIVDLAQGYINLKQFEEASRLLTDRLKRYPSSMRISNTMTRLEIQQHHTQAAERIAERTARLHPSDSETQQLYLQALVFAGNLQAAKPLARKLLDEAPQDVVLLYLNGVLEHDAGDLQAARTYLEKAVSADPADPAPRYNLGQVLAQLNEPQGAKEQLEKALELGATEPEVHLELAKALRVLGETQAAAEHLKLYQQELRGRQTRAMAVSKTAQADKALAAGDPQKATALYREALEVIPEDAQLNYKLAVALDEAGDVSAERVALDKAVQISPGLAAAHNQLGFLASKSGDSVEAEKHFREAIRAAPRFTEAWVNLAATLGLESRFAEAQQAVASALQLDPKNPQALLLRDTLAKALAQH